MDERTSRAKVRTACLKLAQNRAPTHLRHRSVDVEPTARICEQLKGIAEFRHAVISTPAALG
jgi:hypothetical protein